MNQSVNFSCSVWSGGGDTKLHLHPAGLYIYFKQLSSYKSFLNVSTGNPVGESIIYKNPVSSSSNGTYSQVKHLQQLHIKIQDFLLEQLITIRLVASDVCTITSLPTQQQVIML